MKENNYVSDLAELAAWRDALAVEGKRVVLTNGCFDLLHAGHVRYLKEARALGDALVVAVNADASVRALKGEGRPVHSAEDRAEILCALRAVDRVVVFDQARVTGVIEELRPQVYAKGGDYTVESLNDEERAALQEVGAEICILSLLEGRSTSETLKKLAVTDGGAASLPKLGVLGSGKGSNLAAIFEKIDAGELQAEVAVVISDVPDAGILDLARERGIQAIWIDPCGEKRGRLSDAAIKEITDRLRAAGVELVVLAGFMKIVRGGLLQQYTGRMINIHPSLLPKHKGLGAWKQALVAGDQEAGCTVHWVSEGVDTGEILGQARVPILEGDTAETLHARIQKQEHQLYARVIGELLDQ
ncbi:MAG: phosphoribosylglycinamide formyltransferase [Verrucomicrobiales bacterium]|nr:phosphoribosylglycinamide formyltransferase [Verrucomicrobiales bacterium]